MSEKRKDEHVLFAKKITRPANDFDRISLINQGLVRLSLKDIDLTTSILGRRFSYPIYINAMTGGTEKTKKINEKLALIAKRFDIPFFLGSQSVALKDSELSHTFKIARDTHPHGFIVANVSANASLIEAKKAVEMVKANALAIHINLIQELVMGEGDRDFRSWIDNIKAIVNGLSLPVIVKEVGFGMSKETMQTLLDCGVKYIDISGRGGTNFAAIERMRNQDEVSVFEQLGISTVDSLMNAKAFEDHADIYASGGIRNALDVIKSLVLGAKAVGLSYYFLTLTSLEEVEMMERVESFLMDLTKLMVIFNAQNIAQLRDVDYRVSSYAID
ncbi:MAG: type 2 isopentenyl-diphosphate Delta-isomerase [Bacilli bacterium]